MTGRMREACGKVRSIIRRSSLDREFNEELTVHLDMAIEDNIRAGMSPEEARRNALIQLGGLDQTCEVQRDAREFLWLADVLRNFRFAFRRMARSPLLSSVVILSLGLGIGANTAIFSAMRQILFRALPVENPEELSLVKTLGFPPFIRSSGWPGGPEFVFSYRAFREMERQQKREAAELAGFQYLYKANIAYGHEAVSGSALMVSGGYFPLMRVRPLMGRMLIPADDQGGGNPVAMLGYNFWKKKLGGQTGILDGKIKIFGQIFSVVGVAPREFHGTTLGLSPDVFIPLASVAAFPKDLRDSIFGADIQNSSTYVIARKKPGVTQEQAAVPSSGVYAGILDEEIKARGNELNPDQAQQIRKTRLVFIDGSRGHSIIQDIGKYPLYILIAATGMVLLIAMVNAANLLLTRSAARRRELAVCAAIGANRLKIVLQLLSEALLLAFAGGIAGIVFSLITLPFLKFLLSQAVAIAPFSISLDFLDIGLEWPVMAYGLGISIFTGLLFGLYPAWEAARVAPIKVLNQESGHISEALASARVRKSLVCAQVMLSALLLIPTGLFLKSLIKLKNVDLGMRTENLITFRMNPAASGYTSEQKRSLFERMEQELAAIPGVNGVTSATCALVNLEIRNSLVMVEDFEQGKAMLSMYNSIGPGFFRQMGIPLLLGREFNEHDIPAGQKVAIVNEKFVKVFFAGRNPIGRRIGQQGLDTEIVGVVKDSNFSSVSEKPVETFYLAWRQKKKIDESHESGMTFYVRSGLPSNQLIKLVRHVAQTLDAGMPLEGYRTMQDQVGSMLFRERLLFQIAGTLAVLATVLAITGLYGVMAYGVVRRTREIGIRMAIGADASGIRKMVLCEMMRILSIGLLLGIPLGLAISKVAESILFGVKAYDPFVVTGASLALGVAAFAASYLPAWRASRIDPLNALRCE